MCHPLVAMALDALLVDSSASPALGASSSAASTRRVPAKCAAGGADLVDLSGVPLATLRAEIRRRTSAAKRRSRRMDAKRFDPLDRHGELAPTIDEVTP